MKKGIAVLVIVIVIVAVILYFVLKPPAVREVVVYTSLENEEIVEYLKLAKAELPDLEINAIRLSTGELGARMLAEKDNPQADCIWGWAVTNMAEFVGRAGIKSRQTSKTPKDTGRRLIFTLRRWCPIPRCWKKKICRCPKAGMIF
jgi:hypothetical protein